MSKDIRDEERVEIRSPNDLIRCVFIPRGAALQKLLLRDGSGTFIDVVLGFDSCEEYAQHRSSLGVICGRFANRIAEGSFSLPSGEKYSLPVNNGPNHLHGGPMGFQHLSWIPTFPSSSSFSFSSFSSSSSSSSSPSSLPFPDSVQFDLLSPHMDMGYPGELLVSVTFALSDDLSLQISYRAVSDRDTVVNLTHHGYFNLSGHSSPLPAVADHSLSIAADHITPVNDSLIPTGQLLHVAGTPFDFRNPTLIAERIDADHPQIVFGKGYDHNYVLSGLPPHDGTGPVHVATLTSLTTGISMACLTTEPGLQLYTANFIDHLPGKGGHVYTKRSGICLESQHFPDSPNHPEFPSTLLPAGREYRSVTRYVFSIPSSKD